MTGKICSAENKHWPLVSAINTAAAKLFLKRGGVGLRTREVNTHTGEDGIDLRTF